MQFAYATQAGTVTPVLPRYQSPAKPVRPVFSIDQHTAIARHQIAYNALSTASWHLSNGRTDQALGRLMSAARQLKQACAESTRGRTA